jgi:hypothetical protein
MMQRCWKPKGFENPEIQVHLFCDASSSGYGITTYLRRTNSDGYVECNLVMSKARVAPLKTSFYPKNGTYSSNGGSKC